MRARHLEDNGLRGNTEGSTFLARYCSYIAADRAGNMTERRTVSLDR